MILQKEREQVIEFSLKMVARGLSGGTQGNISVFNRDLGLFAISPSSMPYDTLKPEDVVVMRLDGSIADGDRKPSVEHELHRIFYVNRTDVNAVVHTHSLYATAFSTLGKAELPAISNMMALSRGPSLKCTHYVKGGSTEIAELAFQTMGNQRAVLLGNHGVVTAGKDIDQAFVIAEEMESLANIYFIAKIAGDPVVLPPEALRYKPGW